MNCPALYRLLSAAIVKKRAPTFQNRITDDRCLRSNVEPPDASRLRTQDSGPPAPRPGKSRPIPSTNHSRDPVPPTRPPPAPFRRFDFSKFRRFDPHSHHSKFLASPGFQGPSRPPGRLTHPLRAFVPPCPAGYDLAFRYPATLLGVANCHPLAIAPQSRSMPDKNFCARPRGLAPARPNNANGFTISNRSNFFRTASFLGSPTHEPLRNARRANPLRISPLVRRRWFILRFRFDMDPAHAAAQKKNPVRRSKPGSISRKQSANLPFRGGFMNPLRKVGDALGREDLSRDAMRRANASYSAHLPASLGSRLLVQKIVASVLEQGRKPLNKTCIALS